MLIDLATAAGAIGGALVDVLGAVPAARAERELQLRIQRARGTAGASPARRSSAAALGLIAGWVLTSNYDKGRNTPPLERSTVSFITVPTLFPVESPAGTRTVPGLAAGGRF